ncbi:MerR family transcriptional regulator [Chitinophaga defluvii]|uniref:MerR family transcriptional regulator n=1 Tax=Chitinophaga defluvii TaxID=3163343 RepID=A0ABV2T9F4_9BACT
MIHQLDLFPSSDQPPTPPPATDKVTVLLPKVKPPVDAADANGTSAVAVEADTTTITAKGKKRGRKSLKAVLDNPDLIKELDKLTLEKQYYSISEVALMFKVNASLIRYWENEFDILQPKKNRKGDRLFRQEDIHHLKLIYHLLRERKYTIEGAKQKLKEDKKLAARNFEMVQALLKVRGFLTELKDQL